MGAGSQAGAGAALLGEVMVAALPWYNAGLSFPFLPLLLLSSWLPLPALGLESSLRVPASALPVPAGTRGKLGAHGAGPSGANRIPTLRRLAERYKECLTIKEKILKEIEVKKEYLSSLQPRLNSIMQVLSPAGKRGASRSSLRVAQHPQPPQPFPSCSGGVGSQRSDPTYPSYSLPCHLLRIPLVPAAAPAVLRARMH